MIGVTMEKRFHPKEAIEGLVELGDSMSSVNLGGGRLFKSLTHGDVKHEIPATPSWRPMVSSDEASHDLNVIYKGQDNNADKSWSAIKRVPKDDPERKLVKNRTDFINEDNLKYQVMQPMRKHIIESEGESEYHIKRDIRNQHIRDLELENKNLKDENERLKRTVQELKESKENLEKRLHDQQVHLMRKDEAIRLYAQRIESVKSLLSLPPPADFEMPDLHLHSVKQESDAKSEGDESEGKKRKLAYSDHGDEPHVKSRITDRHNRRWTLDENTTILNYLLKTIESGNRIEKPNAPKYYTKMIEECNLSPDINHNLLRNKVQNFRRAYEKAKKDHIECSYFKELDAIWGNRADTPTSDEMTNTVLYINNNVSPSSAIVNGIVTKPTYTSVPLVIRMV